MKKMKKPRVKMKNKVIVIGMKMNSKVVHLLLSFGLCSCLSPNQNYFNKALNQAAGKNEIRYNPDVSSYKIEGGTIRLDGENLDQITGLQVNNEPLIITKQNPSRVIAMATTSLQFNMQDVVNLFVSSAFGQSVIPLQVQIMDSSITGAKISDGAITASKIVEEAVTLDKISTADANDGDVIVYSRTQGQWIPGTIGGLGGGGNNVTSITIGSGLKTDGGDKTITSSGTIQVDTGHLEGQIISLNKNTLDPTGPGYFEHNGIIRAYAIDKNSNGEIDEGEDYGQFSLVNTRLSTSSPRFDYRLSFDGSTISNMVIKEKQNNITFLEFDSNDEMLFMHQKTELTKPFKIYFKDNWTGKISYEDYLTGTKDLSSSANEFLDLADGIYPSLEVSEAIEVKDLHINHAMYLSGVSRMTGDSRFESNVKIDGELEVDRITGALQITGGLTIRKGFDDPNPIFNFGSDGTLSINDPDSGDNRLSLNSDGDLTISGAYTPGGSDYAEYFLAEEMAKPGDVIGINLSSKMARVYQPGDFLIGVVSTKPGIVGGKKNKNENQILVGLLGQVPVNREQIIEKDGVVFTKDNKRLGIRLASGDIYINQTTTESSEDRLQRLVLEKKVAKLEEMLSKLIEK